ncbi:hypothetical protein [Desulfitobacterium sp. AusDCA]|uniref:hypothetical protein n=1 Tax=Desulfitobacterium sp. AusDCA TaxID=3240383 RepID=UPI003DA6D2D7
MVALSLEVEKHEEYQAIWNPYRMDSMLDAHEFKENFICDGYKSRYIEYPIEVSKINRNTELYCLEKSHIGKFVKVAPCAEEHEGKTYLGLFLGDLPLDISVSHNPTTKELNLGYFANPAIFVFELNKIVFGAESWWSVIKTEDELKEITQDDIDNVWYVKALKELATHG